MLYGYSEFQSYTIGYCCKCGADAIYCGDTEAIEWADGEPDCLHALDPDEAPAALRDLIDEDRRYVDR